MCPIQLLQIVVLSFVYGQPDSVEVTGMDGWGTTLILAYHMFQVMNLPA